MYVLAKKKDEKRWQVQIVESVRDGKSVRQKIVRNIGTAYSEKEVSEFKRIGEAAIVEIKNAAKPVLSIFDPADVKEKRKEIFTKKYGVSGPTLVPYKCEHCGKEGSGLGNYKRWHGINCKSLKTP
jgi:tRNA G37 N-methylase Trm5